MNETLMTEFLKSGILVAVLGVAVWKLWKKFETTTTELKAELKELRSRYENELLIDRPELKVIVAESVHEKKELTEALGGFKSFIDTIQKSNQAMINRCANTMQCLTDEIRVVKPILEKIEKNLN